jgi:two-component system response regulator HydG
MRPRVLAVDDKENILGLLRSILEDRFDVTTAQDGSRALALALNGEFDVVVSDIRMPGLDGFTLLHELKREKPDVEVVLMTAYGSVEKAVEAMRSGAYDYLTKPFEPDDAAITVARAAERKRLRDQARSLRAALEAGHRFEQLIGKGPSMQQVFELLARAAATDATVLITGESGTGKELAARAVHAGSSRKAESFQAINCAALPEQLMESELLGHSADTLGQAAERPGLFETGHGGTVFLDEVGELHMGLQATLGRILQDRSVRRVGSATERVVDVRVIAATKLDLRAAVAAGRFRDDLYYRLNVIHVHLPPLRERRDDIPILAAHFLELHGRKYPTDVEGFTAEAIGALIRYDWPGNVRELENAVERALAVVDAERIPLEALPEEVLGTQPRSHSSRLGSLSYRDAVELARDRASREYLILLMKECGGSVTQAAERAGMERESLHRLLKRYGVRSEDFKQRE